MNEVVDVGKRVAFLAPAVLVTAALSGTATDARSKSRRLITFGSCGALLGYAKFHAARFVGPYGLCGPPGIAETAR